MNESATTLGQRIRQQRWDERRLRQRDLAAAVGLSKGYLSQLEHDKARATEPTLRRLALALGLEEFALVTQAAAEDRLAAWIGHRGRTEISPLAPTPASVPPAPPRPAAPKKRWLTTAEAAEVIGVVPDTIRTAAATGRLRPAYRVHLPGDKGPPRWIVATKAALAYRPGNDGYAKRVATPAPAGFVTINKFVTASGLPWATLYRRLDAKEIASVKIGRRRFIPEGELDRLMDAKKPSD
jgi:DNA-binding XRE family transcriptional regulator